jgi:peptidoglycan/xylan/chitin deacetylase (PgdA/CDA1 family)
MLVTPANFESQLIYLKGSGWTAVTLDDLAAALRENGVLPPKSVILTFDDGYLDFYYQAWPIIKKYQVKVTIYVMSRQESCGGDRSIYMTMDMIKELAQSPLITVASHSLNHCDLKAQDMVEQKHEILDSKIELEELIGRPVRHFAYPYGDFNDISLQLVQSSGYETATTTLAGEVHTDQNRFVLHRVRVGNFSGLEFASILAK